MKKSDDKKIYMMMSKLDEYKVPMLYSLAFPEQLRKQMVAWEHQADANYKNSALWSTWDLSKMLIDCAGAASVNNVAKKTPCTDWFLSFSLPDKKLLAHYLVFWLHEVYACQWMFASKSELQQSIRQTSDQDILSGWQEDILELPDYSLVENGRIVQEHFPFQVFKKDIAQRLRGRMVRIREHACALTVLSTAVDNKASLVTDPMYGNPEEGEAPYSFEVAFSLQYLPGGQCYTKVDVQKRIWADNPHKGRCYLGGRKRTAYLRVDDYTFVPIRAEWNKDIEQPAWVEKDVAWIKALYGASVIPSFSSVWATPRDFGWGKRAPFEGVLIPMTVKDGEMKGDLPKEGVPFEIRESLFIQVCSLLDLNNGPLIANQVPRCRKISANLSSGSGQDSDIFNKDCRIANGEALFEMIRNACGVQDVTFVLRSPAAYNLPDEMNELLDDYDVNVDSVHVQKEGDWRVSAPLQVLDSDGTVANKERESALTLERIRSFSSVPKAATPALCLVVTHNKDFWKRGALDPKQAIRLGLAQQGYLTQFLTCETLEEAKKPVYVAHNALLDGLRQLGCLPPLDQLKKYGQRWSVGLFYLKQHNYILGKKENVDLPIAVACDFSSGKVFAFSDAICDNFIPYSAFLLACAKAVVEGSKAWRGWSPEEFASTVAKFLNGKQAHVLVRSNTGIGFSLDNTTVGGGDNSKITIRDASWKKAVINLECCGVKTAIRVKELNTEVPMHYSDKSTTSNHNSYASTSGVFQADCVYYSVANRSQSFDQQRAVKVDKPLEDRSKYPRAVELYPLYVNGKAKDLLVEGLRLAHSLRDTPIQSTQVLTKMPLPLMLAEKVGEYFLGTKLI